LNGVAVRDYRVFRHQFFAWSLVIGFAAIMAWAITHDAARVAITVMVIAAVGKILLITGIWERVFGRGS
jgi:hypothetical protein